MNSWNMAPLQVYFGTSSAFIGPLNNDHKSIFSKMSMDIAKATKSLSQLG